MARRYNFSIKVVAPFRAQTKGKVERLHRYLRESFFVPLQAQTEYLIDVELAKLDEVAACRIHATLKEKPSGRLAIERKALLRGALAFAGQHSRSRKDAKYAKPLPIKSIQNPLSMLRRSGA